MPTSKATTQKSTKKTATKPKSNEKKLTVTLDKEIIADLEHYLQEFGFSKDEFVKKAILEKISRDKISGMIDYMIKI